MDRGGQGEETGEKTGPDGAVTVRVLDQGLNKKEESGTGDSLETLVISDADGQGEDCHPLQLGW